MCVKVESGGKWRESERSSAVSDSLPPHSLWNSPGQNTGVGSLSLLWGSSQPRDRIQVSCIAGGFFTITKSCPTLPPHELQHARLLCSPLCPRVCSDSCPLSWWCYLTTSSSASLLSFLPSVFPSIRVFPLSRLFTSGGQSIGASASVL